jgi:electron transfer flavoprotein alpha subunit
MSSVLIFLEVKHNEITRLSWEAAAAAHQLGSMLNLAVDFAYVASTSAPALSTLYAIAPRELYILDHDQLDAYTSDGYVTAYAQFIEQIKPAYVVLPHTYQVRDFAPRLATRFGQVLISDVTGIASGSTSSSTSSSSSGPTFVRQLLQGKLNAGYSASGEGPCFLSIQAGAFRATDPLPNSVLAKSFHPTLEASQIRVRPGEPFRASTQTVDLTSAPILVSVGRGIKEEANLPIVQELATALGAELAASRPICDNGWLPMERQVGSSGQTVAPKVYIAVGISGAIQHLVGMKGSQCIVAINKDENAPIFEVADYGIVGDLFEIVPALTAAVQKAKGN